MKKKKKKPLKVRKKKQKKPLIRRFKNKRKKLKNKKFRKKIRSKILIDVGSLFKLDYKTLIFIGAAVECIHAYSLIHDDLPCMDNDSLRRGN